MENSYDEECFKKWERNRRMRSGDGKSSAVDRKEETAWTCTGLVFIEESYERQGYRMGIPKQVYVSRVLANIRKRAVRKK